MKILIWVSRILVGSLFIFSGFIKANDSLGFSYKLEEYFEKFGAIFVDAGLGWLSYPMEWMHAIALPMAILIVVAEMVLGVLALLGAYMKKVTWYLLVMILFFTFLTFVSWNFEIVKECGCFGKAIPLNPFQSFIKDLILTVLIGVLFIFRNSFNSLLSPSGDKISLFVSSVIGFMFTWYCYQHLPIMDFRAYAPGNSINEGLQAKKGNPLVIYYFKHKKTGAVVGFSDYPRDGQEWEWIEFKNESGELSLTSIKVKSTGQETRVLEVPSEVEYLWEVGNTVTEEFIPDEIPKIQQLSAQYYRDRSKDYIEMMLAHEQNYFWLVLRDFNEFGSFIITDQGEVFMPNKHGKAFFESVNRFYSEAKRKKVKFHALTSIADEQKLEAIRHAFNSEVLFYWCDDTELKTMIRSSPGLLLLKKDRVINKWHYNDFKTFDKIKSEYLKD